MADESSIPDKFVPALRWVLIVIVLLVLGFGISDSFRSHEYETGWIYVALFVGIFVVAVKWNQIASFLRSRHLTAVYLGLAIIGALALGVALGGLIANRNPQTEVLGAATGRIVWNFDQTASGQGYFLNLARVGVGEIRVAGFQAHGKNTSNDPITQFTGYLRSDATNARLPIYLVAQLNADAKEPSLPFPILGIPTLPEETFGIPGLTDFDIVTFNKAIFESGTDGILLTKFLHDFPSFTVVLEYDGTKVERRFSNQEIKKQIELFESLSNPQVNTNPHVLRKPTATPPIMPSFQLLPLAPPTGPTAPVDQKPKG